MGKKSDWLERFECLNRLAPDLQGELVTGCFIVSVSAGAIVFEPGQTADNLLLLLNGTVRVQQRSATGREVFLYRVHAGESCVLTTACMLAFERYSAEGTAETDVTAVAIPRATFDNLAGKSPLFRQFIFQAFSRRITDLFTLIDDIVCQKIDVRLADRLLELAGGGNTIHATHQVLAGELGTAREVVSRTLAEFQRRHWIEQSRGKIRLVSKAGLGRLLRAAGER